jgi:hypothetical protein
MGLSVIEISGYLKAVSRSILGVLWNCVCLQLLTLGVSICLSPEFGSRRVNRGFTFDSEFPWIQYYLLVWQTDFIRMNR